MSDAGSSNHNFSVSLHPQKKHEKIKVNRIQLNDRWFDIFLTENVILDAIHRVAEEINEDLKDKDPVFICVLNGAFMFAAELIGRFRSNCNLAFIRLQSYEGLERGNILREVQGLMENIENRHVVIVEDIIDSGHTMRHLSKLLEERHPASVRIAVLLLKPQALQVSIWPDYAALSIPNDFIVGFGLDYNGYGRNLRNIYKVVTE
jgi:hypoxanthine phosphoribosyltransferase